MNAQEQTLWEAFVANEQPQNVCVVLHEPIFRDAPILYKYIKKRNCFLEKIETNRFAPGTGS